MRPRLLNLLTAAITYLPRQGRRGYMITYYGGADVLAGRKTVGTITGRIVYAGHKPSKTFLRRYTGYVEQFGTYFYILTGH